MSPLTRVELLGCDRETAYRALCDTEYVYANGLVDDVGFEVYVTRARKVKVM
jgi:hypothetical protein